MEYKTPYVVKVPGINGLGRTHGCEGAGNAILESLNEIYSNEQGKPIDVKLLDLEEIHLDNFNLEQANGLIYKNSFEIFEEKPRAIFLGGDHSISYSTTKAFLEHCKSNGKEPCLIVFDSHPDCMPTTDKKTPTHEEWLRALIESGFRSENILLVGIRNSDKREIEFLSKNKIRIISMNQLLDNLQDSCDIIMEFSNTENKKFSVSETPGTQGVPDRKELYVSIDIDVIDPAFAPSTGYKEPGGLTSRQFIYLIQRINKMRNLRAVDIVEINSEKDKQFNDITVKLGAKILAELL